MKPDLHDQFLRRRLQDQIEKAYEARDLRLMKEVAEVLAESYVQSRVAAKYLAQQAARNVGTLTQFSAE